MTQDAPLPVPSTTCCLGESFSGHCRPFRDSTFWLKVCYMLVDYHSKWQLGKFAEFLKKWDISHLKSSISYQRANGNVEGSNRVIKECLQMATIWGVPFKSFLRTFLMDYRATSHSTTRVSTSELLHSERQMRIKFVIKNILILMNTLCVRVKQKQLQSKQYTDTHWHVKATDF